MKKRKTEKMKKKMRIRDKIAKILHLSWVRFEEPMDEPHRKGEEEEHSMWFRNF